MTNIPHQLPPMALSAADQVRIRGGSFRVAQASTEGVVVVGEDGLHQSFSHQQLHALLEADELQIDHGFFSPGKARLRLFQGNLSTSDLEDHEQRWVRFKHDFVLRFLRYEAAGEFRRSDRSLDKAAERIHGELRAEGLNGKTKRLCRAGSAANDLEAPFHRPSASQLRKWVLRFERLGSTPDALIDRYRRSGNRTPRLDGEVQGLIKRLALTYCDNRRVTGKSIWEKVKKELAELNAQRANENATALPLPSLKAVYRAIQKLDAFRVMAGREGKERARKHFATVHEGIRVQRLLERVEMDEWEVTLATLLIDTETWKRMTPAERQQVERVRCWVTVAIDCASRCILAMHLHMRAPSRASSIAALQMTTQDKTPLAVASGLTTPWFMRGRIDFLSTDGGPAFKDHLFRSTAADLGVNHEFARPEHPADRGTIERFFETLEFYMSAEFSGRTFRNPVERGSYSSGFEASITVDQLRDVLPAIVARYHNSEHEGLGGETPLNAWKRLANECEVRPAPSPSQARHIFGIRTMRRVGLRGIRFLGLYYQSREVHELRRTINQRPVQIRVDPEELGHISVLTSEGWVTAPCVEDFAVGLTASEWIAASTRLRMRFTAEAAIARPAVIEAIEVIRELSRRAHETAGLKPTVITEEEFRIAERDLLRTFRIREAAGEATPSDENDILGVEFDDAPLGTPSDEIEEAGGDDLSDDGDMSLED